ncbi:MAG TPA: hypothetical protein PL037_06450, partial [Elusimicrobiales bacterium]|nr:hypothetical protein [Elusimicrobiales bacterium]
MTKIRVNTLKKLMLASLLAFIPIKAAASWPVNYLAGGQGQPSDFYSIPDGSGGVYNVWSSTGQVNISWEQVYVQHITAAGVADWVTKVSTSANYQNLYVDPMPGYNGAPGLTVAWLEHFDVTEYSPAQMKVQRFNTSGSLGWGGGAGIVVSSGSGMVDGGLMTIASDGNPVFGLAYVNGSGGVNLAVQKTDGANCLWPGSMPCSAASGTLLMTAASPQDIGTIALVPASTQVVMAVSTGMLTGNSAVFAYRINNNGVSGGQFTIANGSGGRGSDIAGLPDGSGGSYFVWIDSRTGTGNLFASRFNVSGVPSGMNQVQMTSLTSPVSGISNMVPAAGGFAVIYTTGSEQTQRAYFGRVASNVVLSTGVTAGLDAMSRALMCRENDCYVSGFSGQTGGHDLVRVPYTGGTTRRQLFAGGYGYYSMDIASSPAGGVVSWANEQGHTADQFLSGQIYGTISYGGAYAQDITLTVWVSTSMDFHGTPYYAQITNPSASQPYIITGVPADTYYMAITASYDWTVPHSTDAWGVLGQLGTPTAIDLSGGEASGMDVTLTDGNTQPNPFSPASQAPAVVYCAQSFANGGSCKIDNTSTYSTALAVDVSSNVYVIGTNLTNSAIVKYDKDGVLLSSVTVKYSVFNDIKVNPVNGDLYVAAQGPASGIHLFRYSP